MLALEAQLFALFPRGPDCPQRKDVLAKTRNWSRPENAEALLIVRPDLGAQAQHKPSA